MIRIVFILTVTVVVAFSNAITDKAYKEYKRGHYKKAFRLYEKASLNGITKADYNLALFYEQGVGVKKDLKQALKYYNRVYYYLYYQKKFSPDLCTHKMLPYYYKTLKKLAKLTGKSYHLNEYKKLKRVCSKSYTNPYIKKCPYAKVVAKADRYNLSSYNCTLYKKYPRKMQKILHLQKRIRDIEVAKQNTRNYNKEVKLEKQLKALNRQIYLISKPILRYFLKQEANCVKRAKTKGDLNNCAMGYTMSVGELIPNQQFEYGGIPPTPQMRKQEKIQNAKPATKEEKNKMLQRIKTEYKNPPLNL